MALDVRTVFFCSFIFLRVIYLTKSNDRMNMTEPWQWQTLYFEFDRNWNLNLNFHSQIASQGVWLIRIYEASKAGARGPVQADGTSIYFGVKLMFVGAMNFGQIQKIRFIVVKIFWSYSNQFLVILIWSS